MTAGAAGVRFFAGPWGRLGELNAFASSGADLAFTGGMTGHDAQTGRLVRDLSDLPQALRSNIPAGMVIADVPEMRIRAQTLTALEHARRALEEAGSSLSQLVSLRLFLRDIRGSASAAGAVKAMLGAAAPATTIVEATGPGTDPCIDVVLDAVGALNGGRFSPRHVVVPGMERLTGGFPAATVLGPYVFTTPVSGADPQNGRICARCELLSEDERALLDADYFNPRDEALAVEQVLMWRNIRRILAATGVPFANILHQNNWLAISMQHYVPVTKVRGRLFGRGDARTAATSLPVSGLRTPGAAFECSVTGIATGGEGATVCKEIRLDSHGVGPYYVGAVKAGRYVFAAGEVPVRSTAGRAPQLVAQAADLTDGLRHLNFGRVHAGYPLMAQAHCVYELIGEALGRYGCTMRDVLHQTVYLVEPAHFPALERVAALHYGARLPPTTLVPIRGASPFRETLLEVEVTALSRDE
jgi:enamine deaminase RidA (YjgF/YER057c/UK114 family)